MIYHVSIYGNDEWAGTEQAPFRTINQAASVAVAGDTVLVHEGTYREWVKPARAGLSDSLRITFEAAPGEKPVIRSAEEAPILCERMQENLVRAEAEIAQIRAEIGEYEARYAALLRDRVKAQQINDRLSELAKCRREADDLNAQNAQIEEMRVRIGLIEKALQLRPLEVNARNLVAQRNEARAAVVRLGKAKEQAALRAESAQTALEQAAAQEAQLEQLGARVRRLQELMPEYERLSKLTQELAKLRAQTADAERTLTESTALRVRLQKEAEDLRTKIEAREGAAAQLAALRAEIYQHPEEDWSIQEICERLCISRPYFHRIYQAAFDVTCTQDVIDSRILRAKQLLETTEEPIADISALCGFETDVYFMRQFKRHVGMTPTVYRRMCRNTEASDPLPGRTLQL